MVMELLDIKEWEKIIEQEDWYLRVPALLESSEELKKENPNLYEVEKAKILDFFIMSLNNEKVSLGSSGVDWDKQRKTIDTIVIHHTGSEPGMTKDKLSALELIRLYATTYANPTYKEDERVKNTPIYSNHFREGKMVFWPYHWIIRKDGAVERLLLDKEIGWHAGDWNVNCRSVAIVLDNDYENETPSEKEITAIAQTIIKHYPNITLENIVGHCEVNPKTVCPSNEFLGECGWKASILATVSKMRQ
jgi:hypothetical protein